MKNSKSTKRAFLSSILSLLICVTMLIGTTFAWFTDNVTSANNIIKAGNLDVEMYWADGTKSVPTDEDGWKDASTDAIFDYDLWEPGYVCVRHVKIENKGSLALKYAVAIEANGEVSELAEVIDVYYMDPAVQVAGRSMLAEEYKLNTLDKALENMGSTATGELLAGTEDVITIALKMQESAGNKYQNMSIGTDFSVKVFATQLTAEDDSFNNQYDANATLPIVNTIDELKNAVANAKDGDTIRLGSDIADVDGVVVEDKKITFDLNGKTMTTSEGASTNSRNFKIVGDSEVTIKNGTLIAEGNMTSGAYGTVRTEDNAKVTLSNVKLYSYRGYGLNVKANPGTTIIINDSEIYSQYGGGVEAAGGTIVLNNTKIEQTGVYSGAAWCSVAIGVNGGGKVTVNSGSYSASTIATDSNAAQGTWVAYVMSSGGDLIINDGEFDGKVAETASAANACGIICADRAAVVQINGGEFNSNGAILDMRNNVGTLPNPVATLAGGVFSANPTISGLYSSNLIKVADGYKVVGNADGTWSVAEKPSKQYEQDGYEAKELENVGDVSSSLEFDKDVAVVLPTGTVTTPMIALDYTGSSDKNFAIIGEDTVFNGNLQISSHPNFKLGDNATLVIDGITVDGTLNVVAYYKNIIIKNVKAKSISVNDGGNVTVENCTLDGATDNGLYVVATTNGYNLTVKNNTIKNSAKNAIQISGCATGSTYGAGTVVVEGNAFENWCVKNDKPRAAFKVWGDSVLAPTSISSQEDMTKAAVDLVNAIKAGNNTFVSENANQINFDFYDCVFE